MLSFHSFFSRDELRNMRRYNKNIAHFASSHETVAHLLLHTRTQWTLICRRNVYYWYTFLYVKHGKKWSLLIFFNPCRIDILLTAMQIICDTQISFSQSTRSDQSFRNQGLYLSLSVSVFFLLHLIIIKRLNCVGQKPISPAFDKRSTADWFLNVSKILLISRS